jgi:hypothetical protein
MKPARDGRAGVLASASARGHHRIEQRQRHGAPYPQKSDAQRLLVMNMKDLGYSAPDQTTIRLSVRRGATGAPHLKRTLSTIPSTSAEKR